MRLALFRRSSILSASFCHRSGPTKLRIVAEYEGHFKFNLTPCVKRRLNFRTAGSFPEHRLVTEPTSNVTTFYHPFLEIRLISVNQNEVHLCSFQPVQ